MKEQAFFLLKYLIIWMQILSEKNLIPDITK